MADEPSLKYKKVEPIMSITREILVELNVTMLFDNMENGQVQVVLETDGSDEYTTDSSFDDVFENTIRNILYQYNDGCTVLNEDGESSSYSIKSLITSIKTGVKKLELLEEYLWKDRKDDVRIIEEIQARGKNYGDSEDEIQEDIDNELSKKDLPSYDDFIKYCEVKNVQTDEQG